MRHTKLLQLDESGIPDDWVNFEHYVYQFVKDNVSWSIGPTELTINGGVNKHNVKSKIVAPPIFAVSGERSPDFFQTFAAIRLSKKNTLLFLRDGNTCAYCGDKFNKNQLSRDHIHPVSKNGKDEWMNVITACLFCNQRKGNTLLNEYDKKLLFKPYVPNRAERLIFENPNITAEQLDYLSNWHKR